MSRNKMLNKSGKSGHPCIIPNLKRNTSSFSSLSMTWAVGQAVLIKKCRQIPSTRYPEFPSCKTALYHNQDTDTDKINIQSISLTTRSISILYSNFPHPRINLCQSLHFHNFVISIIFYKWNYIVCNLIGLAFHSP